MKKADILSQKLASGAAAASTNDLDGFSKQQNKENTAKENRDKDQKENRFSPFSDSKRSECVNYRNISYTMDSKCVNDRNVHYRTDMSTQTMALWLVHSWA